MADAGAPHQLGPYLLGDRLAVRERSTVYAAIDSRNNERAAVKALTPQRIDGTRPEVDFGREVRMAEEVEHPNLLRIRDWGWESGQGWIAYELADGGSLQDHVGEAGHLEAVEVRRLGVQIGGALMAVHQAGLLHRDVKPSNILIHGSRYLLGDFGAVRWHDPEVTSTLVGSVPYMAPEQAQGEMRPETDIYCLGATLYRAWTGNTPPLLAQREPEWPPHTEGDPRLRYLIASMLHPDPDRRPTLDSLERLLQRTRRTRPTLAAVGGIAAVLLVGIVGFVALSSGRGESPTEPTAAPTTAVSATSEEPDTSAEAAAVALPEYIAGGLAMTVEDPNIEWGPNPVYYLYRGMRFHIGSPEVLTAQVDTFGPRGGTERLGWDGWPDCCRPYAEIEHLEEGPELAFADDRSEWLVIRRDGDPQPWVIIDGIRVPATEEVLRDSPGPQGPDDAIVLAAALFDAIPTERAAAVSTSTPACLVASGAIAELYEVHREGLGENLACETTLPDRGAYARWQNGTIWWHPEIGARLVVFSINEAYWGEGGAEGWLGYPVVEEADEASEQWDRIVVFERGVIVWSAAVGTDAMTRDQYLEAGGNLSQ